MNILITGTTSGIGLKLAQDYLSAGHTVHCCGRNKAILQDLVTAFGERAKPISFDVQNREDCLAFLSALPELDLEITSSPQDHSRSIEDSDNVAPKGGNPLPHPAFLYSESSERLTNIQKTQINSAKITPLMN